LTSHIFPKVYSGSKHLYLLVYGKMQAMIRNFFRIALLLLIACCMVMGAVFAFLFLGEAKPAEHIDWGVTFGHSQAEDLGLDWRETYLALLDDVGVRNVRIPIYWDELEREKNTFDFSSWDWQLEELEKRGGKAMLVIGFKLPRWPECRFPQWVDSTDAAQWEPKLFRMLRAVVVHYQDSPTVWAWQVENEPLLRFGVCPQRDHGRLDDEVSLVRQLDPSRPIVLTDTGENSFWIEAGKRADIIGSTLYRIIHNPTLGYVHYPYPPVMYARKYMWEQWLFPHTRMIFSEVQAEPWVTSPPISQWPLATQYETMSPQQFLDVIAYVRKTGFDTAYLWGAEWWYWAKATGDDPRIWDEARVLFNTH
jgi:hypothetical protein